MFAGVVVVSFIIGFIFTVMFESPMFCALDLLKRKLVAKDAAIVDKNPKREDQEEESHIQMIDVNLN